MSSARIAVIGGGPSGLGCAVQLNRLGQEVHLFEQSHALAGLVDSVIPAHRLPHDAVAADLLRVGASGIHFHLEQAVDAEGARRLAAEFDAVFIATGSGGSVLSPVPGLHTGGVFTALDFLQQARRFSLTGVGRPELGERVVVVGGGNVAVDAAVVAKRLEAGRVFLLYRRSKGEMPAWETEYMEAASLGIEFRWLSQVKRILTDGDRVSGVEVEEMRFARGGRSGRRHVEPDPAAPLTQLRCDAVVMALGQTPDESLAGGLGLALGDGREILVNPVTFQTGVPKIFAAGEAVTGGSAIVHAMSQGMAAGRAIHSWLFGTGGKHG